RLARAREDYFRRYHAMPRSPKDRYEIARRLAWFGNCDRAAEEFSAARLEAPQLPSPEAILHECRHPNGSPGRGRRAAGRDEAIVRGDQTAGQLIQDRSHAVMIRISRVRVQNRLPCRRRVAHRSLRVTLRAVQPPVVIAAANSPVATNTCDRFQSSAPRRT